jgi:chromosome segregation ATPase
MNEQTVITIIATVCALLGGAFGAKLLDRWFDREKDVTARQFTDNEQARLFLARELKERDEELASIRESERSLLKQVGDLTAQVARQEERGAAHATQIEELRSAVGKWGNDYAEMKAERDRYRDEKHSADNRLTAETLRAQLAARDLSMALSEIDRLKGQLEALSKKDG